MSWDERLFGWFYGAWARVTSPPVDPERVARQARLADVRGRLRLLASAVAGASIEVGDAEEEGAAHAVRLTLPVTMAFASTPELNTRAYVLRAAFGAMAIKEEIFLPDGATSPMQIALFTVIATPAIDAAMARELPSALIERRALAQELAPVAPVDAPSLLEAMAHARLCGSDVSCQDPDLLRFAQDVLGSEVRRDELEAHFDKWSVALSEMERRAKRRARAPRASPLLGWVGRTPGQAPTALPAGALDSDALPKGTEVKGKARETLALVKLADNPSADNPLIHSFEKVETVEEYRGGSRTPDGSDQLDEHAAALEELDVREIVRSREQTHSLLRADVMMDPAGFELLEGEDSGGPGVPYHEWNYAKREYRQDWCVVRSEALRPRHGWQDAEARVAKMARDHVRVRDAIRAELRRLELTRRWRDRQLDGSEIDIDAMSDRHAALRSGHTPPRHLYRARRRHAPSLAVLVLLDGSLSTDGWVLDRRVLEVEQQASVVLGEALDGLGVELGFAAFRSNTRRDCRFAWIKRLDEDWRQVRRRVAALEPSGYTRIGPAIRHATTELQKSVARRRLLLVLTDGKPTDYDRYEGRYGIADVRQAVREAELAGCRVDALAIDPEARFSLPQMFGASRHHVLKRPDDLPAALGRICAEMQA